MKPRHDQWVTEAEFLSWPESTERIELIDGFVVRQPAATFGHQEVLRRILFALGAWAEGRDVTIGQSACDIRFGASRILQPDAFVILERLPMDTPPPITRIPELCIEVMSRRASYDRMTKRLLYAAAGVREFWGVDRRGRIERWTGKDLAEVQIVGDVLRTPLLPDFELDVRRLLAEA
jgi:Uma2 family endonuclease